ncbi:hypothetical protein RFI_09108 [Reticulomyxa filosa]|uniref:acetyl-CoA C-acetyltransferase n=1 Tax=Reticulomyxa filosa TaxID=46433 RepID=X6NRQ7_RETFI|nr:hypothetical protein RFI_09108 [Reticulomyxa filosa]|eukprot:ETO28022.1 hypothetical protein RFI_09108 [Reticulomyxa filosa]
MANNQKWRRLVRNMADDVEILFSVLFFFCGKIESSFLKKSVQYFTFMKRRFAYIVSAARTPIGVFNGGLASLAAPKLGALAAAGCFNRCSAVSKDSVNECIFGNVLTANVGQNPARQVSREVGEYNICIHVHTYMTSCMHCNKIAGGMESMTNVPYYSPKTRFGARMGDVTLIDGMVRDGLSDAWDGTEMGVYADRTGVEYSIPRSKQDDFAIESYKRAQMAHKKNLFKSELVPVEVPNAKRGQPPTVVDKDEGCLKLNEEKLRQLKPAFGKDGSITAGNASQLSDGAAALLVVSEESVKDLNLKPLAKVLSYADAEQAPELFGTTPSLAIPKALQKAGLDLKSITDSDFFEINEAFASVALANQQLLKINPYNLNLYGGAIALGHPIGCSGARILVTLLTVLKENKGRYGIAGICNGGGGGTAMVVENLL